MIAARLIAFDKLHERPAAALLVDGKLHDFIVDPVDNRPIIGAFYRARASRALKGQGGMLLDLGNGQSGYLRGAKGIAAGQMLTVQIASYGTDGKADPLSTRLLFKSRYCIITPDAPGYNIARSIKHDEQRDQLHEIAHNAMQDTPDDWGLILRSGSQNADPDTLYQEILSQLELTRMILADQSDQPCLLYEADAHLRAQSIWTDPAPDQYDSGQDAFERLGVLDHLQRLDQPDHILSGGASFAVEPTKALVAVDVNTGGDFSPDAALKANLGTAAALPRALRLRGLGGQIVIDFAPCSKSNRRVVENALRRAFKADPVETALVGWTPLGHFELQRKQERLAIRFAD